MTPSLRCSSKAIANKEVANKVTVDQLLTHSSGLGIFFGPEFAEKKDSLDELKDYLHCSPASRYSSNVARDGVTATPASWCWD